MGKVGRRSDHSMVNYNDYWYTNKAVVQRNAPFGTKFTPTDRLKIIGGKQVRVIEHTRTDEPASQRQEGLTSPRWGDTARKSPTLAPLTEKPNHIDPTHFIRNTGWGYNSAQQDNFNSQIHGSPTKYSIIPPIGYGKNVDGVKMERPPTNPEGPGIMNQQQTTVLPEFREDDMFDRYLPRNCYLPDRPISISRNEELALLQSIYRNVKGSEFNKLKDIYTELSGYDRHLTGYITFQDLSFTFLKNLVSIPTQTLRLIAAMNVSESEPGKVNYENILKFVGAALRDPSDHSHHPTKGPESPRRGQAPSEPGRSSRSLPTSMSPPPFDQRATYYNPILQQGERYTRGNRKFNNPETSKLIRMLERAIRDSDEEIDYEKVLATFRQADRDHRGRLSAQQIKDLLAYNRLPLQDSLIEQILAVCSVHNGQYDWEHFLYFIERVLPAHTGLDIPRSKRPLEYAKDYGIPSSNWPKYETPRETPLPSDARYTPRNSHSPSLQQNDMQSLAPLPDIYTHSNGQPSSEEVNPNTYLPPQRHPREEDFDRIQEKIQHHKRIDDIEQQLKDLESTYQDSKKQLLTERQSHESEPWFDRFMKLAKAMYRNDSENTGFLSYKDTFWLLDEYNDTYNLNFTKADMNKLIRTYCPDGDRVQIDGLLKALSLNGEK